ncbi:hypothetical protein RFI_38842 [Reticulomyxa filosa]|uniref:Uncharacterized protein n=1 Tax=Reticulomyxa filosa TaxID=46433 RepID=X6LB91_RETFI|nr:hypothetical protein RFI_38842 [Reticulomyxa filosa]|eukprot:ETN98650.1 hypothetical protein RFI_38842 [Reticulomyxa filosa]
MFGTVDKSINPTAQLSLSSCPFSFLKNCLMFQSLERLLLNKWELPEIKLQHDESVILNRVYERLYFNLDITLEENDFEQRIHTDNDRIRAISKWKVQLTKYINTIDTGMNDSIWTIYQCLSYFLIHQKLFGDAWKAYQRSFHIWFLKQCCMSKGFIWTQMFVLQPYVKSQLCQDPLNPISQFRHQVDIEWLISTCDKDFGTKYTSFKKCLVDGEISISQTHEKHDFACLLTTVLCTFNLSNVPLKLGTLLPSFEFHCLFAK